MLLEILSQIRTCHYRGDFLKFLEKGMTELTGETGGGKSIIIDAMNMIWGSQHGCHSTRSLKVSC